MVNASLYTHVARYCEPCAEHERPRLHRYERTTFPVHHQQEVPGTPHHRGQTKPMRTSRRWAIYVDVVGKGRELTHRQLRQLARMHGRQRRREVTP